MIVKVCGMKDARNIRDMEDAGAQWIGLIFAEQSPRHVTHRPQYLPIKARRIGVFVNSGPDLILNRAEEYGLDGIQLHGHESPELCDLLRQKGLMVIKAFAIKDEDSLAAVYRYEPHCDYFLFDTPCSGYGGSGKQFDWSCLQHYEKNTPFILSGGINPASISQLKRFHHSRWAGIDLNSGFELSPGYKDPKRVKEFIEELKNIAL